MTDFFNPDILWTAQQSGHDWRDEAVLSAVDWLTDLVPSSAWASRMAAVEGRFDHAVSEWAEGRRVPLFDPIDSVAWYIHQARRYGDPELRTEYFLPEGYRIVPIMRRIGQILPDLRKISGGEERAAKLMTSSVSQPDDGLYELLVAGAYSRRGWQVSFVPEAPGVGKRNDLFVERGRSNWALECKRAGRSGYGRDERLAGEAMADRAHELARAAGRSLMVLAQYTAELHLLGSEYLVPKVERFLEGNEPLEWEDEGGMGGILDVEWEALHEVMRTDDVYFGSSRMFQLIFGRYEPSADFTMAGDWVPAQGRPLHATWVNQVSLVAWGSFSNEAARRKAMHFRSLVSKAAKQLPGDRPGAIHVGYETVGGNGADARRHLLNGREMRNFDAGETRLRTVYGNYFMNELVTDKNESAAVVETTAWYSVGKGGGRGPAPAHLLFMDEDGTPGSHLT